MPADTLIELTNKIEAALDRQADTVVDVAVARREIAEDLAQAVNDFVIGRLTSGPVTGSTANTVIQ